MNIHDKFDLNDISIIPAKLSNIYSRSECNPLINSYLPILASPMDTVVDEDNIKHFLNNKIVPCIPRGCKFTKDIMRYKDEVIFSFSLAEVENSLEDYKYLSKYFEHEEIINIGSCWYPNFYLYKKVLIDMANGHINKLVDIVKEIKSLFPDIYLMVGNIANPETYKILSQAGADGIRCAIGNGNACLSASNLGINYPMASLIIECKELKENYKFKTEIIADGGMRNYSDIIKALGLGADKVMVGSIFNKCIESAGDNYLWGIKISRNIAKYLWWKKFPIKKKFRGMSTKEVQRKWGKKTIKTAEGITRVQNVNFSLYKWSENMSDYLKSAMSYCDCKTIEEFVGGVEWVRMTNTAFKRYDK